MSQLRPKGRRLTSRYGSVLRRLWPHSALLVTLDEIQLDEAPTFNFIYTDLAVSLMLFARGLRHEHFP
jgi:hypothetical protein